MDSADIKGMQTHTCKERVTPRFTTSMCTEASDREFKCSFSLSALWEARHGTKEMIGDSGTRILEALFGAPSRALGTATLIVLLRA